MLTTHAVRGPGYDPPGLRAFVIPLVLRHMPEEALSFEEHKQKWDDNPTLVRCARCGHMILGSETRCPECGINFQGQAWEYTHPSELAADAKPFKAWMIVVAIALIVALLL